MTVTLTSRVNVGWVFVVVSVCLSVCEPLGCEV